MNKASNQSFLLMRFIQVASFLSRPISTARVSVSRAPLRCSFDSCSIITKRPNQEIRMLRQRNYCSIHGYVEFDFLITFLSAVLHPICCSISFLHDLLYLISCTLSYVSHPSNFVCDLIFGHFKPQSLPFQYLDYSVRKGQTFRSDPFMTAWSNLHHFSMPSNTMLLKDYKHKTTTRISIRNRFVRRCLSLSLIFMHVPSSLWGE